MAKPRTNHDTCAYWADGILAREPVPSIEVNSIIVRGDKIYSFGSHFPMGIIQRDSRGRCVRVLLNADTWPGPSSFANTGGDQSSVRMEVNDRVAQASWEIEVRRVFLTAHGHQARDGIPCKPREGDPEPPWPYLEIPTYFFARDPGPEPVKSPNGCITGTVDEYEWQSDENVYDPDFADTHPWEFVVHVQSGTVTDADGVVTPILRPRVRRAGVARHVYGERRWCYQDEHWQGRHGRDRAHNMHIGIDVYVQCPHCAAFEELHNRWSRAYHGGYSRREPGYKIYAEMMETYGSEQEWREARRRDWRSVREGREIYKAWRARNYIPFEAVTWIVRNGVRVPNLDADGYPTRKDQEAHYRAEREKARRDRRYQRQCEQRAREQRQIERLRARRQRNASSFEARARLVAVELANLNQRIIIPSNDSQE